MRGPTGDARGAVGDAPRGARARPSRPGHRRAARTRRRARSRRPGRGTTAAPRASAAWRERAAEAVTLALEREVGVRDRLRGQRRDDRLGLRRRHDPVVEALEDEDRGREPVGEVDSASARGRVGAASGYGPTRRIVVARFELVAVGVEQLEVADPEVADARPRRRRGRPAPPASCSRRRSRPRWPAGPGRRRRARPGTARPPRSRRRRRRPTGRRAAGGIRARSRCCRRSRRRRRRSRGWSGTAC